MHVIMKSRLWPIRIPCILPAARPVVRTIVLSKRIPLPAVVNINALWDDVIQHADASLSLVPIFIRLNNDADGPGRSFASSLFTPPLYVASSSDVESSGSLSVSGLIESAPIITDFLVIALIESIGTPVFGLDAMGIDPTVIAEAVPSSAIKYRISRVLARNIVMGVYPVSVGRRVLLIRASVPF